MERFSNNSSEEILSVSLRHFPAEIFDQKQRLHGGFICYVFGAIYSCYALFIICDKYFIPALNILIKKLGLANDVAGATIMAMASAAPGFFISIISTFITHNDLGLGNILGSCVFNVYVVIGICGLLIKQHIHMEWWPITRDFAYYIISLNVLAVTLSDNKIYWYEALILLIAYGFYVLILKYSEQLKCFLLQHMNHLKTNILNCKTNVSTPPQESKEKENHPDVVVVVNNDESIKQKMVLSKKSEDKNSEQVETKSTIANTICPEEKESSCKLKILSSIHRKLMWFLTIPIDTIYFISVPDCKKEKWEKFYLVTFVISIIYVGIITYFVSWMATVIGVTFCIPDTIMGYTALAIGTSMADLFCSLAVARQGLANMAIANGIGSNIMDILFNLSIPWIIVCILPSSKGFVNIPDKNINYIIISMIVSIFPIYIVLLHYHFNLNHRVALISLFLYIIFITFSILFSVLNNN